ncbi:MULTISPECIES: DUF418 domain-containing protein [unclassified Saccharopolyspora]|uniref:DUF418 domain-containing protein n=1 Tax=unclassified Saccharopolyspora TaxID=2646250 RepID=UPI001CD1C091|nr:MULTISPECIES: DUF418 domain-containing protein [unclassified Saccharopolyspora]MCA1188444.1 DUF418 domain-containing protein [Saccharopolyspora sp. 6T]MCA1192770.1 DUF418 domain-containing protein [Saccharopolyspora sp. 6V]MCA1225387.1 DUF418 domain-containing protein [Saccharopolyspora sp. 6M]MCA1279466.1 DUF418 domain-containing protein [Saccharopolyspora sp. 7B]
MSSPTRTAPPASTAPRRRIGEIDAVRGLALCGILFVNIPPIMEMSGIVDQQVLPGRHVLDLFVQERFFPIFSLLFGVGFGLFLRGAGSRHPRPRLLLVRRLLALFAVGLLHSLLHPGEALTPYALFGLVFLLPLSWANRWVNLVLGLGGLSTALVLFGGGLPLIPGLLVLGFALAQLGVPEALPRLGGWIGAVFALAVLGAAVALPVQERDPLMAGFATPSGVAGICLATAYATGLLLLLRTPLRGVLGAVLEPLGRMALTNYVTATLLLIPLGQVAGLHGSSAYGAMALLATGILLLQLLWSRFWLARFRQGPLEWAWRCFTWWDVQPFRR